MAAALKVSAAPKTTDLLLSLKYFPSFPILVVFPTPFTPDTTITAGQTYTRSSSGADNNNQNLFYSGLLMDAGNNFDDDTALDATGSVTTGLTGIWRAMGEANNASRRAATLFLRIS